MEAKMTRKLVKRFNRLDIHDAILNSITLDFVDSQVKFNLEYIVNLIEESGGVFKPIYRNANLRLTGVRQLRFEGELDSINKQIIYDFDLIENSAELNTVKKELKTGEIVQFHIYTSSNLTMDIFGNDFIFEPEICK
jgi:hypothetical protein